MKPKAAKARRVKKDQTPESPTPTIPITAIPQLYNQQMLRWMQTFYDALKTLHEDLDEIKQLLKE